MERSTLVRLSDARGSTDCALFQVNEHLTVTLENMFDIVCERKSMDSIDHTPYEIDWVARTLNSRTA